MNAHSSRRVEVGDVIMSPLFGFGHGTEGERILVGRSYGAAPGPSDPSRTESRYVVEEVVHVPATEGASECRKVLARRLAKGGAYDPDGEAIAFHMEADYVTPFIDEVIVVGKMKRVLSFL